MARLVLACRLAWLLSDPCLEQALLQGGDIGKPLTALESSWGPLGGIRARKAALWVQLQREAWQQGILPAKAVRRLQALGVSRDVQVRPAARTACTDDTQWMAAAACSRLESPESLDGDAGLAAGCPAGQGGQAPAGAGCSDVPAPSAARTACTDNTMDGRYCLQLDSVVRP